MEPHRSISNSVVKRSSGDDSWGVAPCKNSSMPGKTFALMPQWLIERLALHEKPPARVAFLLGILCLGWERQPWLPAWGWRFFPGVSLRFEGVPSVALDWAAWHSPALGGPQPWGRGQARAWHGGRVIGGTSSSKDPKVHLGHHCNFWALITY